MLGIIFKVKMVLEFMVEGSIDINIILRKISVSNQDDVKSPFCGNTE